MDLREFVRKHKPDWERFEALLSEAERRGMAAYSPEQVEELGRRHRRLNADYAFVDTFFRGGSVALYLNSLVARAHGLIYRRKPARLAEMGAALQNAPAAFRRNLRVFAVALGLFCVSLLLGYEATLAAPQTARAFLPEDVLANVREGKVWTRGIASVMPGSWVSLRVFANNLAVLIAAFGLGLTGLGTAYVVLLNGFMLGCLIAYCEPYGQAGALLEFTLAHGPLEISAILISATGGLMLARAVISPGLLPRGASLRLAARDALSLFMVALIALGVAAILEGLVSTDDSFPAWARAVAGLPPAGALFFWLSRRPLTASSSI